MNKERGRATGAAPLKGSFQAAEGGGRHEGGDLHAIPRAAEHLHAPPAEWKSAPTGHLPSAFLLGGPSPAPTSRSVLQLRGAPYTDRGRAICLRTGRCIATGLSAHSKPAPHLALPFMTKQRSKPQQGYMAAWLLDLAWRPQSEGLGLHS